jgi:hypothetical protein
LIDVIEVTLDIDIDTGTFVDTLLRTDFAIRKYPSYAGAWPLLRPDFHRLEDACFAGHAKTQK